MSPSTDPWPRARQTPGACGLAVVVAVAAACSTPPPPCVPGAAQACVCTDGRGGAQSCNAAGGGYDTCVCTSMAADSGADAIDAAETSVTSDAAEASVSPDVIPTRDALADAVPDAGVLAYNDLVLRDRPVAFWNINAAAAAAGEPDLTAHGHAGAYHGGARTLSAMPNGDMAARFDGATQYLSVPSSAAFSIPTTGDLTWEAWIQPGVLEFPNNSNGYIAWMGKCASYSPTCEWESRMYNTTNPQGRCNRFSAYAFNPTAGLGSGADWQPTCGLIGAGRWHHVVGEYTTRTQPASCPNAAQYPGALNIWVNGVAWNQARHSPTGCMSQYSVIPAPNGSPLNIGSMAQDSWFQGAIGKVAIYDYLLTQTQIAGHYRSMTGGDPVGSCADTCTLL